MLKWWCLQYFSSFWKEAPGWLCMQQIRKRSWNKLCFFRKHFPRSQQRPEANKRLNWNRCEMSLVYCLLIKLSSNALVSTTISQMNLCGPAACSVLSWNDSLIFQGKMTNSCLFQLLKCEGFFLLSVLYHCYSKYLWHVGFWLNETRKPLVLTTS